MTNEPWNDPTRKRYYAIPFELAYEAVLYNVPISEMCIDALKHAIREKKSVYSKRPVVKIAPETAESSRFYEMTWDELCVD